MRIRRLAGAGLMALGALGAAVFAALGVAIVANYIEPENVADALATAAIVIVPGMVAGAILLAMGRWLYGGWRSEAPLLRSARAAAPVAGLATVAAFGVLLIALLVTGFGPEDRLSALKHGMGVLGGGAVFVLGRRLRPPASRGSAPAA